MIGFLAIVILAQQKITLLRIFLQTQLPFYMFPVILLFAVETLQQKVRLVWFLLFIPALTSTICISADLFFLQDYSTDDLLYEVYNHPPFFYHLLYKGNQLFFIAGLFWVIEKLRLYKREIKDKFSFIDPINLEWLTNGSWAFLILTLISLITFLLSNFKIFSIDAQGSFSVVSAFMVLVIFYLSLHGIRQYSIGEYYDKQQTLVKEISSSEVEEDSKKYKSSALSPVELESIYEKVLKLFEDESIYRESKLQLQDVADRLQVSSHSLSQTINTKANKPFYDFVNVYRVKYLQKLLEDPSQKRFTILALGVESGFNSKASLNRVFKEHTGLSPSEYQKRHLQK